MRHLYVHVPFCVRRCSYCDFAIAVRKRIPAQRFVEAIGQELALRREAGEWDDEPVETLYFGGGTPSLLPPASVGELINLLGPTTRRPADRQIEITLEANPDDVTAEAATAWVRAGVNRLSLGAQSFNPRVLAWMHRTHDVAAVESAVRVAQGAGIDSLSLDLIFGLPDELHRSFADDLERVVALRPNHVSVYGLSVEPRTPLARWVSRGATGIPSDDRYADEFLLAHERLTAAGLEHYEVSNYARAGHRSRHNSAYWALRDYAGLGPAAHSMRGSERRWTVREWTAYDRALREGRDPVEGRERLGEPARRLERLYLGLRTDGGIDDADWWGFRPGQREALEAHGWLAREGGRNRLSAHGWLYLDEIITSLTTSADSG